MLADDSQAELHRALERIVAEETQQAREQARARAAALHQRRRRRRLARTVSPVAGDSLGRKTQRS